MADADLTAHGAVPGKTADDLKQASATIKALHRLSALLIGAFLVLHIANHLVGLLGQPLHIRFMQAIRPFYRNAVVEPALLMLIA